MNFLSSEFPNSFHLYAWDWRKSPEEAIAGLDALVDRVRQPGRKVVLMAHSMGGLVTRLYVGDQTRADKVSRVLTAGTPYFGSPKALFPFVYGVESPGLSGLDAVIANEAMLPFARYMQGMFFLWPSARYGGWLSIEGRRPSPLGSAGVLNLIDERGGNPTLLSNALPRMLSASTASPPAARTTRRSCGTGVHTIGAIRVDRAPAPVRTITGAFDIDERDIVKVTWTNGDGTVPFKSAIGSTPDVRQALHLRHTARAAARSHFGDHSRAGLPGRRRPDSRRTRTVLARLLADGLRPLDLPAGRRRLRRRQRECSRRGLHPRRSRSSRPRPPA